MNELFYSLNSILCLEIARRSAIKKKKAKSFSGDYDEDPYDWNAQQIERL